MTEANQDSAQQQGASEEKHAAGGQRADTTFDAGSLPRGRVDQMSALLSKGLDLAEAGLGLGVTLVNKVGVVAQQQIVERFMSQPAAASEPGGVAGQPEPEAANSAAPPGTPADASETDVYGISNRMPLLPGGQVKVSFSINNDSMEAPKKVALSLEGFVGDSRGRRLNIAGFTVKPARKSIAPMDFEKFVIQGALPPKTPPDVYRGWVIVSSDSELRIPVRLVVSTL